MYLGIDFGTCYSSAALLLEGVPTPIPAPLTPGYALPSSVFITEQGEILVGQAAENKRQKNPQRYRREFKRDLGSPDPYTFGNTFMLPEELVTEVLKKLKGEAEKVSQARGEKSLTDVLITVPATYSSYKRNLMQEAAKKAGFRKIELLEEPVAAAIYYSRHAQINDGDIILVYDLGGGTFDATLMQRQEDKYQFLGMPKGLANCGGKDCDCLIYQHLKSNCSENLSQQLESKDAWRVKAMVGDYCRDLKHQLSEQLKASVYIPLGGGDLESFELTRDIFNKMISPLIEETLDCCEQLVRSAGKNWQQVNRLLLVGGSSRIPYVKEAIERRFNISPFLVDKPELAVCLGATIYNNISIPMIKSEQNHSIKLLDQVEEALGIKERPLTKDSGQMIVDTQSKLTATKQISSQTLESLLQEQLSSDMKLLSAKGINYKKLQSLLMAQKWREADEETAQIILSLVNRTQEGFLNNESMEKIPQKDLGTIDRLWVKYSNERFGFSIQKRIWHTMNNNAGEFGERVGWRGSAGLFGGYFAWKSLSELIYSLDAPAGHLPCILGRNWSDDKDIQMSYFFAQI
jgi:molecular chaperone DnaK (HSP70)